MPKAKGYRRRPARKQPRRKLNKAVSTAVRAGAAAYSAYRTYSNARAAGTSTASRVVAKTVRSRQSAVAGSGVDMDSYTYASGRPLAHNLGNAWKLLDSQRQRVVLRWSRVTRFDLPGAIPLLNNLNTIAAVNTQRVPVHVFDVSSFQNNGAGTITFAAPGASLAFSDSAAIVWEQLTGQDAGGLDRTTWNPEDTPGTVSGGANNPLRRDIWNYINVRMNLYGTVQRPTKYKIQLVQFKQDHLVPSGAPAGNDLQTGTALYTEAQDFWTYMAKPYTFSNLNDQPPQHANQMKVLKAWDFIINPPETTETLSSTPHFKECNIFMRMNKLQRYDTQPKQPLPTSQAYDRADYTQLNADVRPYVQPKDRVYLIIRALAASGIATALTPTVNRVNLFDANYHPSYDIVMKTSHDIIE